MMLAPAVLLFASASAEGWGQCVAQGGQCGWGRSCCGAMECEEQGFLQWRCVHKAQQCAQEGKTCAGPGLPDTPCCENMRCEQHFLGTSNKQCVKPAPQCKSRGEICG